jgi:hypothetical protein
MGNKITEVRALALQVPALARADGASMLWPDDSAFLPPGQL